MTDEPIPTDRDELHDRLLDRALRERIGGEKVPDLSEKIVGAAKSNSPAATAIIENPVPVMPPRWVWISIAASILVVVGAGLLIPAMNESHEAARTRVKASGEITEPLAPAAELPTLPNQRTDAELGEAIVTQMAISQAGSSTGGGNQASDSVRDRNLRAKYYREEKLLGDGQASEGNQPPTALDPALIANGYGGAASAQADLGGITAPAIQVSGEQQSESLALGVSPSSPQGVQVLVRGAAPRASATVGLDPGGAAPGYTVDLDLPYRQGSFGLSTLPLGKEVRANGDNYAPIVDNPFRTVTADSAENRLSTFSIDVDTASYANVRQFLMQSNMLPPPDAVRIEELVNYFKYDYAGPGESAEPMAWNTLMAEAQVAAANAPFGANVEVAACPWAPKHRLVRFGIKGREVEKAARPKSNLVFLVDVSGSMDDPQKLPLLVDGMRMLTQELGENDRVAIVVYASTEGLVLESTRGDQQEKILAALDRLSAGGSTAGGAGIQLAYKVAADNFIEGGTNRVILCTDGDFNVGVTDVEALKQLAADKAKDTSVFLTVLGFGRGNLNDELMEAVADNGNGAYHYVDNRSEARKVLVEQMTGTLVTIAKDVKIQVEFNPTQVAAYRLIGYENRVLAAEDFNNDAKDAGEIGAGHTVTALYEIVPIGEEVATSDVDDLKYAPPAAKVELNQFDSDVDDQKYSADAKASSELLTLKIRYKQPDGDTSTKLEFPVTDAGQSFAKASSDFQFASSVAGFGMLLRGSPYKGDATFAGVLEIAESSAGNEDPLGYRREFTQMIARAKQLAGE